MGDVVDQWMREADLDEMLSPERYARVRAFMRALLAAERAAATAACAAHVEEHISRAVGRAWIAEEIRALSPEGWVGVRRDTLADLRVLAEVVLRVRDEGGTRYSPTDDFVADLRAALEATR